MASVASLFSPDKYRLFSKNSSSSLQDDIPLFRMDTRQNTIGKDNNAGKQPSSNRSLSWCYFLHTFLIVLHLTLLVISVSNHAERRIIVQFANETFTTGLSGGLQAFYTLYTALLVFVTQGLVLSATFSGSKKLTQIHDICEAWAGFGAALSTLWSQTKVTSSILSVIFVTAYFTCVSVLHVASSTIMQFQPFNDTVSTTIPAVATWPGKSVNLSSLDWTAVTTLVPFLQSLYDTTNGLANNTLYSVPTRSFGDAIVNATTLNAHCGLLTNLSIGVIDGSTWNVSVSMTNMDYLSIFVSYPPLLNEIWLSPSIMCLDSKLRACRDFIPFLVTAAMETDNSVNGINHVYLNGAYGPDSLNISTPISLVACSLSAETHIAALGPSGSQLSLVDQPTDIAWSIFSPGGDSSLTRGISYAMEAANSLPLSPYCQATMTTDIWNQITAFNAYTSVAFGIGTSSCNVTSFPPQYSDGASLAKYTSTSSLLTRNQVENAASRIATEFIWLAGELGNAGGGFDRQMEESRITEYVLRWRLNINPLPVIVSLCASVILCIVVVCMLWGHDTWPVAVSGAGVLEIMWLGSRSQGLRDRLRDIKNPSVDGLRAFSMFETSFWTRSACVAAPMDSFRSSELHEHNPLHTSDTSRGRRWCYVLHLVLVNLHILLLILLIHHPEHSAIIPFENDVVTTGLSALLEAIYTAYSAFLVTITQRLALLRIVGERRRLTTVHDVSGAWTGIGAAIYILWQQRQVSSSIWEIVAVATYLASMLVLHIGSSSIMQWQAFNLAVVDVLSSDLALPSSTAGIGHLGWSEIFPIVQSIGQDMGVTTYGLSNNTLYDVPLGVVDVALSQASVNATTIDVQCGLVTNLTTGSFENAYRISFDMSSGTDNATFLEPPLWKDIVYLIIPQPFSECAACPQTLFYMITTGVSVDESVRDSVTVKLNWTYTPPGAAPQLSVTLTYVGACSLSSRTVPATLNLQEGQLSSTTDQTVSPSGTSWSVWSPGNATDLSVGMTTAFTNIAVGNKAIPVFKQQNASVYFKETDIYLMEMLGLDLASANVTSAHQSSANPSVTLSPSQLENAIAQTAARFLWVAGQLGESVGGFQRATGEIQATGNVLRWRLHLNMIPILFASIASFTALILVPFIIGKKPSKYHSSLVSGTSVLESLWLEAQSETLHLHLRAVREPCLDTLRATGMFDISLGDVGRSSWAPRRRVREEQEMKVSNPGDIVR